MVSMSPQVSTINSCASLRKKATHGLQTAGLEKSQVVHSEARWDQHMYKEVVTNVTHV